MGIRNLSHLISLLKLRPEITFTLNQLEANPLTEAHVPAFQSARDEWDGVFKEELVLYDKQTAIDAVIISINALLNALASELSKIILSLTGDDKTHPYYVAFFKNKSLYEFQKLVMGAKLIWMIGWVPELMTSVIPQLAAIGPRIEAATSAGSKAIAARDARKAEMKFFRDTGNRKKHFDKVNSLRKTTYGDISKMPHETLGLPLRFAEQFFLHGSGSEAPTLESVGQEIAVLEAKLAERGELRAALEAEAEAAAEEARQAEIAALKKIADGAAKKADEAAKEAAEAHAKIADLSH